MGLKFLERDLHLRRIVILVSKYDYVGTGIMNL